MENKKYSAEVEFLDELDPELMSELGLCRSAWTPIFRDFLDSDRNNCVITFKNSKDKRSCLQSLRNWKSRYGLNIVFGNYSPGDRIYIVKGKVV